MNEVFETECYVNLVSSGFVRTTKDGIVNEAKPKGFIDIHICNEKLHKYCGTKIKVKVEVMKK